MVKDVLFRCKNGHRLRKNYTGVEEEGKQYYRYCTRCQKKVNCWAKLVNA